MDAFHVGEESERLDRRLFVFHHFGVRGRFACEGLFIVFLGDVHMRNVHGKFKGCNVGVGVLSMYPVNATFTPPRRDVVRYLRFRCLVSLLLGVVIRVRSGSELLAFQGDVPVRYHALYQDRFNFCPMYVRGGEVVSQFNVFLFVEGDQYREALLTFYSRRVDALRACDQRRRRVSRVHAPYAAGAYVNGAVSHDVFVVVSKAKVPAIGADVQPQLCRTVEGRDAQVDVPVTSYAGGEVSVVNMVVRFVTLEVAYDRARWP